MTTTPKKSRLERSAVDVLTRLASADELPAAHRRALQEKMRGPVVALRRALEVGEAALDGPDPEQFAVDVLEEFVAFAAALRDCSADFDGQIARAS